MRAGTVEQYFESWGGETSDTKTLFFPVTLSNFQKFGRAIGTGLSKCFEVGNNPQNRLMD